MSTLWNFMTIFGITMRNTFNRVQTCWYWFIHSWNRHQNVRILRKKTHFCSVTPMLSNTKVLSGYSLPPAWKTKTLLFCCYTYLDICECFLGCWDHVRLTGQCPLKTLARLKSCKACAARSKVWAVIEDKILILYWIAFDLLTVNAKPTQNRATHSKSSQFLSWAGCAGAVQIHAKPTRFVPGPFRTVLYVKTCFLSLLVNEVVDLAYCLGWWCSSPINDMMKNEELHLIKTDL